MGIVVLETGQSPAELADTGDPRLLRGTPAPEVDLREALKKTEYVKSTY